MGSLLSTMTHRQATSNNGITVPKQVWDFLNEHKPLKLKEIKEHQKVSIFIDQETRDSYTLKIICEGPDPKKSLSSTKKSLKYHFKKAEDELTKTSRKSKAIRDVADTDQDNCPICLGDIEAKKTLEKCGHSFCEDCLNQALKIKSTCPLCKEFYGKLIGNQPENGTMSVRWESHLHLPGYEKSGTIIVQYSFSSGIQGPEHPNPGVPYPGTTRCAFLPDNPEGNKVLGLLRRAFDQRLTFTIGTSMTTGRSNVITWNDIHHKTNTWGGPQFSLFL
nr:PREDICTED: probable E3 ubiquitin-protein ligase DTX3 isoform X2 [Latimeria chalumnae]|eukprot:XP_014352559.1 PREDICTED: probable E3 ubiquitin-protein ligase DTX3 isoform X2 [Latimeria chalumnae]